MVDSFQNEVVLISGSASGIGKGIAKRFLEEGANLFLLDIHHENLVNTVEEFQKISRPNQRVMFLTGDVSDRCFRENAVQSSVNHFGEINVFVNCAGIYPSKPVLEITEEDWDKVLNLNLKAAFFMNQLVLKSMVEKGVKGRIVNISSTASEVARPGVAHYCASKAGLKMLTQVLALEFAPYGIRINALGPGLVETETLMKTLNTEVARKEHEEKVSYSPLKRAALVEEIADGVLFFASNQSTYVTGQTLLVDGGYSAGRVFQSLQ